MQALRKSTAHEHCEHQSSAKMVPVRASLLRRRRVLVCSFAALVAVVVLVLRSRGVLDWSPSSELHGAADICTDSCGTARNGICEEGRSAAGALEPVLCDLGTDCTDCGPVQHVHAAHSKSPVKFLIHETNTSLFTRRTVTDPPFHMLIADPTKDVDVSWHVAERGHTEGGITDVFRMVLKDQCVDPKSGKRRLVLDVGANLGYFTLYAAMMGCRVIAWEPIPLFGHFIAHSLAVNNLTHLVTLRSRAIMTEDDKEVKLMAPRKGNWGMASVQGMNQASVADSSTVTVLSDRVDSVVDEDVLLMKVDVEGFEPIVLSSASRLFESHNVENLVLEYNPGVVERTPHVAPQLAHLITDMPIMLMTLLQNGFRIGLMEDALAKGELLRTRPFPELPEVTQKQLLLDIKDSEDFLAVQTSLAKHQGFPSGRLNCPPKQALINISQSVWFTCAHFPEDAHPKSLRSSFFYNTNVWASRNAGLLKLKGRASAMPPGTDASRTWTIDSPHAVAGWNCAAVPVANLVRDRCHCKYATQGRHPPASADDVAKCHQQQAIVDRMLAAGEIKFTESQD